ncbi:MAG TPA: hypothetical protein VJR47_19565, partial [Stellaceae bacterium]|nr:hypothetical protein [Stellaceae bacterium]
RAAIFLALRKSESEISMVVFMAVWVSQYGCPYYISDLSLGNWAVQMRSAISSQQKSTTAIVNTMAVRAPSTKSPTAPTLG